MRIGFDARATSWAGIGRYIEEILTHLASTDHQNEYYIYYHDAPPKPRTGRPHQGIAWKENLSAANFSLIHYPVPVCSAAEQIVLPPMLRRHGIELFHSPYINVPLFTRCHRVVTIHDIHMRKYMHNPAKRAYFELMTRCALASARRILVVSSCLRDEVVRFMPSCAEKVTVVRHGVSTAFRPVTRDATLQSMKREHHLQGDYFLFVGTFLGHKNLPRLIRAFRRVKEAVTRPCQLVVAAAVDQRFPEPLRLVKDLGLTADVRFIGHVPKHDLPALYSAATALVCPSLYESFCLPILEAMSCGTPVIASALWAVPEVVGEAALLVDPRSEQALAQSMLRLHGDASLRARLRQRGLRRAREFSWFHAARQLTHIYETCR